MSSPSDVELIADFVVYMRSERALSELTIDAYQRDVLDFSEILVLTKSPRTLFTADTADVATFLEHLTAHSIEPISRARKIASLRLLYKWLERKERIEKNPMRLTVLPKIPKRVPKPVDQVRMSEIIQTVDLRAAAEDAKPIEIRDLAILETLYSTACRREELRGMNQQDLTLRTGRVIVRGKGNKERIVILGTEAIDAITHYLDVARKRLVKSGKGHQKALFLSEQGTRISPRRIGQIVEAAGNEDDHLSPHRFRHSGATHMLDNGADIRKVQELLGHADLGTTQGYTQVTKAQLKDAHGRFHPRG